MPKAIIEVNIRKVSLASKPLRLFIIYNKYSIFLSNLIPNLEGLRGLPKEFLELDI